MYHVPDSVLGAGVVQIWCLPSWNSQAEPRPLFRSPSAYLWNLLLPTVYRWKNVNSEKGRDLPKITWSVSGNQDLNPEFFCYQNTGSLSCTLMYSGALEARFARGMDRSEQVYSLVLALLSEILEKPHNLPEPRFPHTLNGGAVLSGLPGPLWSSKIPWCYEFMLLNAHCWLQFLVEWPDCVSYFSFKGLVDIMCTSTAPQD